MSVDEESPASTGAGGAAARASQAASDVPAPAPEQGTGVQERRSELTAHLRELQRRAQREPNLATEEASSAFEGILGRFRRKPTLKRATSLDEVRVDDGRQNVWLKKLYAYGLLLILAAQLVAADAFVYLYASKGRKWDVPPEVIKWWLAATVIQVIGVVLIVTRHLFPTRESDP